VEKLVKLRKNEKIKAIILRIDSPGGGVGPAQEIHAEVKKAQKEKKVLVSMGSVAASGGYYIACAADRIIANPGSITGSIGVIVESLNVEELLGKLGLRSVVVKSGKHKDLGSPMRPMTGEDRKLLQGVIDSVHEQFIKAVAEGRKLPWKKFEDWRMGEFSRGTRRVPWAWWMNWKPGGHDCSGCSDGRNPGRTRSPLPGEERFSLFDLLIQETMQKIMENLKESAPPLNFLYYWPFRG